MARIRPDAVNASPVRHQRPDISPYVVHLVKEYDYDRAFRVLVAIVQESRLKGGDGYIRNNVKCVCVSEAPLAVWADFLANWNYDSRKFRYQPFGIQMRRTWFYAQGGRPVIYGEEGDFYILPQELKHRFMLFEPSDNLAEDKDFTWEREWRLKTLNLPISPDVAQVIVPNSEWFDRLELAVNGDPWPSDEEARLMGVPGGRGPKPFPWTAVFTEDD